MYMTPCCEPVLRKESMSYLLSPSLDHQMNSGKERNKTLTSYSFIHFWNSAALEKSIL